MAEFLLGGLSSMTATLTTHPIDLIKVRYYLHGEMGTKAGSKMDLLRGMIRQDGFRGLYFGLSAALLRQAFYTTSRYGIYSHLKRYLGETPSKPLPYYRKVVATMVAGSVAAVISCPADTVLVRMQADSKQPPELRRNYKNAIHGLYCITRNEGPKMLYRGLGALVTRGVLVTTAQFSTYDTAKEYILRHKLMPDGLATHFTCGAIAGFAAAVAATPADVIKTRVMNAKTARELQGGAAGGTNVIQYSGAMDCLMKTVRTEGVLGLYKGFGVCYMRMAPQVMLMFIYFEKYTELFRWVGLLDSREYKNTV